MAEVKKARLFLRRGTDTDRKTTTLCEGELGYSTDAFRVVVGDGTVVGGRTVGTTVFISGGSLAQGFHTRLTDAASYAPLAPGLQSTGLAMIGDLTVSPAAPYFKADGVGISTPSPSATTIMMLTGGNVEFGYNWVAVNSGIPWGNIHVQTDDIKGDYISGGDISGDVTFSGTVDTPSVTGTDVYVRGLVKAGAGNRSVVVTAGGKLLATEAVDGGAVIADGGLKFLPATVEVSQSHVAHSANWTTSQNWSGVPRADGDAATIGLFQFVYRGYAAGVGSDKHHLLEVRQGSAATTPTLTAAYERVDSSDTTNGGAVQFSCPLSSISGDIRMQYRMRIEGELGGSITTDVFDGGHDLRIIGYM